MKRTDGGTNGRNPKSLSRSHFMAVSESDDGAQTAVGGGDFWPPVRDCNPSVLPSLLLLPDSASNCPKKVKVKKGREMEKKLSALLE